MPLPTGLVGQRRQDQADAAAFGLSLPRKAEVEEDFDVEETDAVMMFLACKRSGLYQWLICRLEVRGLAGFRRLFDLYNVEDPRDVLERSKFWRQWPSQLRTL